MRTAILDLGTNTFNLLITETGPDYGTRVLLSRKEPVKLGQGGINRGEITPGAFERGLAALTSHMVHIHEYGVDHIHAFATSAIRSARNGSQFVDAVRGHFNIDVQVISGDREAVLIYQGVRQAVDMEDEKHLILDIGGGSNELIIANDREIFWKESFSLGMARLLEHFNPSDPIREDEILSVENYISRSLTSAIEAAMVHSPAKLIGSSGTFDTFRALLQALNNQEPAAGKYSTSYGFSTSDFFRLYGLLINSTAPERLEMKGMDPMRVEMIVIAGIFVNFIIRRLNIRWLIQSDFALKEGAVIEILRQRINPANAHRELKIIY
jgi:exopolyphosphatase / guanosine-5'-triphosphate,3'-diphosphate pyrophosphatase